MMWRQAWAASRMFRGFPQLRGYTLGKACLDPAYPFVARALRGTDIPILDVGCGAGHLAAFLRANGCRAPIRGIDIDQQKIHAASRAVTDRCAFFHGDAMDLPEHKGHVVMLDVLHYIPADRQQELFTSLSQRLGPDALGLVRLTIRDASWRFLLTRFEEWFVHRSGWIPLPQGRHFPTKELVIMLAANAGLLPTIRPMWGTTPFNSYMLELRQQ